jgi:methylated-DNA-protein-cysteine methyltransferase-like protein
MACAEYETYYAIIRRIPSGRVMTYGEVADWAGAPGNGRRVGYALAALRDPSVPWWRVINARGEISPRRAGVAPDPQAEQQRLLRREGVRFGRDGRIDLARYRHRPARALLSRAGGA